MAEIIYSARALENVEHAFTFAVAENPSALTVSGAIESAVRNLAEHPLVGRRVEDDLRELVISFGETGFIALYRFIPQRNQVRVLALRHQHEMGYTP